jgi:hypothetical protein
MSRSTLARTWAVSGAAARVKAAKTNEAVRIGTSGEEK